MTDIDLYQLYGARQDTDAAVIRDLMRRLHDAEARGDGLASTLQQIEMSLKDLGLSFRRGFGREHPYGQIVFGEAWEDGPGLTRAIVDSIRPEKIEEEVS